MKKVVSSLIVIFLLIFALEFISSAAISQDLHLNIQTTDSSGSVVTGTFDFVFNISTTSDCSSVVYSNLTNLTTDIRGIISYYLPDVTLDYLEEYYLCYYRDGTLINASKIVRTPYSFRAKNITLSGVEIDSNLDMSNYNVTADTGFFSLGWSYLTSIPNLIYGLWDSNNLNDLLVFNGTAIGYNQTVFNDSVDARITANEPNANVNNSDFLDGYDSSFFMPLNTSVSGNFDFNGGWQDGGVTIDGGDIYVQTGYFYNITSLNVTKQNLTVLENFIVEGNVGIGTDSPTGKLDIVGSAGSVIVESTGVVLKFTRANSASYIQAASDGIATSLNFVIGSSVTTGTRKMIIQQNGYIGIGTVTPQQKLNVIGDLNFTGELIGNYGTYNSTYDTWAYNMSDGSYNETYHTWAYNQTYTGITGKWNVSGSNLFPYDLSKNVGIGTSSPNEKFEIQDEAAIDGSAPVSIQIHDTRESSSWTAGAEWSALKFYSDDTSGSGAGVKGKIAMKMDFSTGAGTEMAFFTDNATSLSQRMVIDRDGKVGIGTSSPQEPFHLSVSNDGAKIRLERVDASITQGDIVSEIQSYGGEDGSEAEVATIAVIADSNWTATSSPTRMAFGITPVNSTANSIAMTIDSTGNVGIGTSSPIKLLAVSASDSSNTFAGDATVHIGNSETAAFGRHSSLTFGTHNYVGAGISGIYDNYDATNKVGHELAFYTKDSSSEASPSEQMRIDKNGNVGIGTDSPGADLEIYSADTTARNTLRVVSPSGTAPTSGNLTFIGTGVNTGSGSNYNLMYIGVGSGYSTPVFTVKGDGKVGIGTSSPTAKLDVVSNIRVRDIIETNKNFVWNAYYDGGWLRRETGATLLQIYDASPSLDIWNIRSAGNGSADSAVNWNDVMAIDMSTGNIGIGTSSPDTHLTIGSGSTTGGKGIHIEDHDDAYIWLEGDEDNVGEDDNTYIKFSQDNQLIEAIMGQVGAVDVDPQNSVYTGTLENAFMLGTLDTSSLQFGTEGNISMTILPSGNVGIGTSSPSAKLDVEVSSGGAATIGSFLNSASGDYAVAMGYNTNASGNYSTAMGRDTNASRLYSTSMGSGTAALGVGSTAMGRRTIAQGWYSTAMGGYNNASGDYAVTMGGFNNASGNFATVMGAYSIASGSFSTAIGKEIQAGGNYVMAIALADMNGVNCAQDNSMCIMGGNVGIGTATPQQELNVVGDANITGDITYKSKQITSDNYLDGSMTEDAVFDKLSPFIPNTGDNMVVSGGTYNSGNTRLSVISRAQRDSSTAIQFRVIYIDTGGGRGSGGVGMVNGDSTVHVVQIAW